MEAVAGHDLHFLLVSCFPISNPIGVPDPIPIGDPVGGPLCVSE